MRFELLEPDNITEAIGLLAELEGRVLPLAGSTDVLVQIKNRTRRPTHLLSLAKIPDLDRVEYQTGRGLSLGPLVTHSTVAAHPLIREKFTALSMASGSVGSPQVRNLGTVAGNLANASPAADTAPALLALSAVVTITGPAGARQLPLEDFFLGPGRTALNSRELITEIFLPEPLAGAFSTYLKLGRRRAMEIAICGVGLAARRTGEKWLDCRLALGAVAPTPILAVKASALLEGRSWDENLLQQAGVTAAGECSPIDDQRASAAYRLDMVEVLTRRTAMELLAKGGSVHA